MGRHGRGGLIALGLCLVVAEPSWAQDTGVVVHGRVEDAATRRPIEGARVRSADSSSVALTDSLGYFDLRVSADSPPWVVDADRLGYTTQRFRLEGDPASRRFILLLEPAPIPIEGITAAAEAALTELVQNIEARRNAYPHAMNVYDRAWLDRFGPPGGSVFDLVHQKMPGLLACRSNEAQLCVPGRSRTVGSPYPERRIDFCVDGVWSMAPGAELRNLPIASVAMVELYHRDEVRVYTSRWLLQRASRGQTHVVPLWIGCPGAFPG